jgi:hypothetical protein
MPLARGEKSALPAARRQVEIVWRLRRGEGLEWLSRQLAVIAAGLSRWREQFFTARLAG